MMIAAGWLGIFFSFNETSKDVNEPGSFVCCVDAKKEELFEGISMKMTQKQAWKCLSLKQHFHCAPFIGQVFSFVSIIAYGFHCFKAYKNVFVVVCSKII